MDPVQKLLQSKGHWQGKNRVQTAAGEAMNESSSSLIVTPNLRETFLRIDQIWSWQNQPQMGSLLIGYDPKSQAAMIHWIDTWHNGPRVMPLVGSFNEQGRLIVLGHFPAPPGPDWGWRIEIEAREDQFQIDMACVEPSGQDNGGVWAEYRRSGVS